MLIKWISFLCMLFLIVNVISPLQANEKNPIKAIVFDFGSVIVQTNQEEIAQFVSQSLHISQSEALDSLKQLKEEAGKGMEDECFWLNYANSKKIKLPHHWQENLDAVKFHAMSETPGMVDLVKDLQKQGYQTALLSNIRRNQADIKRKTGLYDLFHPVLLSYAIGVKKPNPKAYEILLSSLKLPPQAVLFIDNKQQNIEAAQSLGIDGILFISSDQIVQELKKRGINVSPQRSIPIQTCK